MKRSEDRKDRTGTVLLLIFLGLAAGILAGGYFAYRNYEQNFRTDAERHLSAIAELKVSQLVQYRKERLGDASIFFKNPAFSSLVKQFFEQKNNGKAQRLLQSWLTKMQSYYTYEGLVLFDTRGIVRMSFPEKTVPTASLIRNKISEVLRSGMVVIQDFHRNEHDQKIYLTFLVPIVDDAHPGRQMGVLLLCIDPSGYLYPFIQTWPVPSRTSETLIARREGNDAVFLNELRFQKNTALNLRIPLNKDSVAVVKAVLGQEGIVDAVDYRGEPIIADVRKVPDSPWFLVCRMDKTEIYEPLRSRLWLMIVLVGALLGGVGASVNVVWHRARSRFYREQYQSADAVRESEMRFRQTFDLSPVGIVMVGLDKRFHRTNNAFSRFLGYSAEELAGKTIEDITFTEDRNIGMAEMKAIVKGEIQSSNVSKRYVRKDGKVVWGEVTISLVRDLEEHPQYFLTIVQDVTERKQNEADIRRLYELSERSRFDLLSILEDQKRAEVALRLKNLVFDASISANSIADLNGVITEVNEAFVRVWGYPSKDEVVGKPIPYFLNDQNEAVGIVTALNNTGQWEGDYTAKRKDGSTFVAHSLATNVKDEKGKVIGYQSAVNDITALKEAEKELKKHRDNLEQLVAERTADLKKSEEKFRTVADFTYDWEYWIDTDRRMLYISPSCERVTGFPPASFYEDPQFIDTIIHPEDRQTFLNHVESYHTGDNSAESCEMEFRIVDRNGCTKSIGHLCTPITGDNGVYLGRRASNRDITERKKTESIARWQRDLGIALGGKMRLDEALILAIDAAIGISGMDCGGVYMLDEASGALDLIYHKGLPADFVASSNHYGADSPNNQIVMRGVPIYASIPALDVDTYDTEGLRAIAIIPMLASGKVIGCMNVASHAVYEVPIEARNGLEVLTTQASAALARMKAEEELKRQSVQLEAANKELEAFSYSVSHDLRAPLRSIDGFSQALLEEYQDKLDENGKNHLTRVRSAAQRMAQLIDDVLDLSRIHRVEMLRMSVDLTGLAKEIIHDLRETQPRKNVEVAIEPGMSAVGDTQLLRLFLQNLLENAWKFTSKHEHAKIEIGSGKTDGKTVFFVKDDGAGFEMAHADMLFAPFQRLHSQAEFAGTGVGLASAQRIIHRHGGTIWAESEVEKGATFYFTL